MKNIYHRDIMEILLPQGSDGMRLYKIARRIYNMHADLFDCHLNYEDLRRMISNYMWRQSLRNDSPFIRNKYGVYAIRPDLAVQLDLFWDLRPVEQEEESHRKQEPSTYFDVSLYTSSLYAGHKAIRFPSNTFQVSLVLFSNAL